MKKLYFGFILILSGVLLTSAALIAGAISSSSRPYSSIFDSQEVGIFIFIGFILFLIGIVLSVFGVSTNNKSKLS